MVKSLRAGTAEGQPLDLGSGMFIPGFEDQLVGTKAGESKDVEVTFPEELREKTLAGKPAVFAVKVNAVKEKVVPEANDDFAQDVSEFDTFEEYKAGCSGKTSEEECRSESHAVWRVLLLKQS